MTISITGGTGLVGSRLLRRFVDAGVDCCGARMASQETVKWRLHGSEDKSSDGSQSLTVGSGRLE